MGDATAKLKALQSRLKQLEVKEQQMAEKRTKTEEAIALAQQAGSQVEGKPVAVKKSAKRGTRKR